jgi:hypothetical protein
MTAYVVFLIVLWIGIIAMLIGAAVVLLALFGGGAAVCIACRRLTGIKRKSEKTQRQPELPGSHE